MNPRSLPRCPDLTQQDLRKIRGMVRRASAIKSWNEFGDLFVDGIDRIVATDGPCWNVFDPSLEGFLGFQSEPHFTHRFNSVMVSFVHTVFEHPVLRDHGWEPWGKAPILLSDFENSSSFRENPLYREVYRHLESNYQIGFTIATVSDRAFVVTLNRRTRDYGQADLQRMHLLGTMLKEVALQLDQRLMLERQLGQLAQVVGAHTGLVGAEALTEQEIRAMGHGFASPSIVDASHALGVTRDTFDGHLAAVREKLGLDHTRQLRAAMSVLQEAAPGNVQPSSGNLH